MLGYGLAFLDTEEGKTWLRDHGREWLEGDNLKLLMMERGLVIPDGEEGKVWFRDHGKQWLESYNGKLFMLLRGLELLDTEEGKAWFMEGGWGSIKSDKGREWFNNNKDWEWFKNENGKLFFLEHIVELGSGPLGADQTSEINHTEEADYREM